MEVTIKTNVEQEARLIMFGPAYFSFITEFWEWLDGPGCESDAAEIRAKYLSLGALHNINFT